MSDSNSERPTVGGGRERQFGVYVAEARGGIPVSLRDLERRAGGDVTSDAHACVAGLSGADFDLTMVPAGRDSVREIDMESDRHAG